MTTEPHSPQNANNLPTPPVPAPRNRWIRLAFTILPFFVYLLAQRIPLPTVVNIEHANEPPEAFSIVALGIVPWLIAVVIVEIVAVVLPAWRHLRHEGMTGRAKLQQATNMVCLLIAAGQASLIASRLTFMPPGLYAESPMDVGIFLPQFYATSPVLVVAGLVAGAHFVRLLADFVTRRGLTHGYGAFFAGELLLSSLRTVIRGNQSPEWMAILKLSGSVLMCVVLMVSILMEIRSAHGAIESDKP